MAGQIEHGPTEQRHSAAAEYVRRIIEAAGDSRQSKALVELFGLAFGPDDDMPSVPARRQRAALELGYDDEYMRKELENPLLEQLAKLFIERHGRELRVCPDDTPEGDIGDTSQPNKTWPRLRLFVVPSLILVVVALVTTQLLTDKGVISAVTPGDCGPTTAQLFTPATSRGFRSSSELYMYVPNQRSHQTHAGWARVFVYEDKTAHREVIHTAEIRLFALSYHNESGRDNSRVIARLGLPPGANLLENSVCLYRNGFYGRGTRYRSMALVAPSGMNIGNYTAGTKAYLTFSVQLPDVLHLSCGLSEVSLYGKAGTEGLSSPDWAQNASGVKLRFTRKC